MRQIMDALEQYIHDHTSPEEELLHELDRATNLRVVQPRMLSGHIQGRLLEMLVRMLRPRRILEIGTFTGYSALSMAAGLEEGGELHTIEVEDELEELAQSFFDRSPHGAKIRLHIGSALDIAPALGMEFDLVFIDGDKREYPDYYRMLMGDGGTPPPGGARHAPPQPPKNSLSANNPPPTIGIRIKRCNFAPNLLNR